MYPFLLVLYPLFTGPTADLLINVWLPVFLLLSGSHNGRVRSRALCRYLYLWCHIRAMVQLSSIVGIHLYCLSVLICLALWTSLYWDPIFVKLLAVKLHQWEDPLVLDVKERLGVYIRCQSPTIANLLQVEQGPQSNPGTLHASTLIYNLIRDNWVESTSNSSPRVFLQE